VACHLWPNWFWLTHLPPARDQAPAIKAGLRAFSTSAATTLSKEKLMLDAMRDLAANMPKEAVHLSDDRAQFAGFGTRSDEIVSTAIKASNMEILFFDDAQVGDETPCHSSPLSFVLPCDDAM
jgi:hypothetical protein